MNIFRYQFIAAIQGGADVDKDGYVAGTELGEFLQKHVVHYSAVRQHPQYGKLRDPYLDQGDFVFPVRIAQLAPPTPSPPRTEPDPAVEMWSVIKALENLADLSRQSLRPGGTSALAPGAPCSDGIILP